MSRRPSIAPILAAIAVGIPGTAAAVLHIPMSPPLMAGLAGMAVIGAAFLLIWACDAAQADVSQALALAAVALIAVLPEYAVDMYFTWQAGKMPASDYASYAVANMTGANRLLIGVAWAAIALIAWVRTRRPVVLEPQRRTEVAFLGMATLYAFVVALKGSLEWYDGMVFLWLYARYIAIAAQRPTEDAEPEGPACLLTRLPRARRRAATGVLFLIAGGAVLANASRFCEGLIGTGEMLHVSKFLLVQWLAPVASESPEFIVALMFATRGQSGLALGSLLCAKLNQWTLLVGMIPGVFAVAHGTLEHPLPMSSLQMHEILLTAAQSLLAVVILATLRLTVGQAALLFGLFAGQLVMPGIAAASHGRIAWGMSGDQIHQLFALMYTVAAVTLLIESPGRLRALWRARTLGDEPAVGEYPECHECRAERPDACGECSVTLSRN